MLIRNAIISLLLALGVAACGSSQSDRSLSGAGVGAGVGAAGAAATGGNAVTGGVVGAAAGAAAGALTDEEDIDLGEPAWE
ncbi:MAG: hypothetical protein CMM94_03825 [Rickettsiales bacterium]|nr:hypothetical protein [Rickettsiales bacterium]|tara:strand:- start:259 stop:501 length:243 start_codon:yes stop_codon:yes gene_type:complete